MSEPGNNELCSEWEHYPSSRRSFHEDLEAYRKRLIRDAPRLFMPQTISFTMIRVLAGSYGSTLDVETHLIHSIDELRTELPINKGKAESLFYILPQQFSWGQFRITQEAFQRILTSADVFAPFLNVVHLFGEKVDDDHDERDSCQSYISHDQGLPQPHILYEFCYNIWFVEKTGRKHGDQWSMRHTGVYQKVDGEDYRSTWIILQPSQYTRRRLETLLRTTRGIHSGGRNPMWLHVLFISAMADNWVDYLADLHSQVMLLDEKACFSRVGRSAPHDYALAFSDSQGVQLLRRKLLLMLSVFDACLTVARRCEHHCDQLNRLSLLESRNDVMTAMESYATLMLKHKMRVETMIKVLHGTDKLLSKTVEFRNDELLRNTNQAMQHSLDALRMIAQQSQSEIDTLRRITQQIQQENQALAEIVSQAQKDSKILKGLTIVGTMYLPASLIAVSTWRPMPSFQAYKAIKPLQTIFSSNLVQLQPITGEFAVARQFWVYLLITVPLMALTLGLTLWLEKRWLRGIM